MPATTCRSTRTPKVGNNALICAALGLERGRAFAEHRAAQIGIVGRSARGSRSPSCARAAPPLFEQEPFVWECGRVVHSVAVISGGAPGDSSTRSRRASDAFLTGETAEHVMADARENGVHFIAGGHYATERFGIRRLGELVAGASGRAPIRRNSPPRFSLLPTEHPIPWKVRPIEARKRSRYMAIHLTPTELGRGQACTAAT